MTYVSRHGDVEAEGKFPGSRPVKIPFAIAVNHVGVITTDPSPSGRHTPQRGLRGIRVSTSVKYFIRG